MGKKVFTDESLSTFINKIITYTDNVASTKANSSHAHTKAQITDFPTSLKNPNSFTIQGNGTTLTNGVYDGSTAQTVNITPSSIGAAASSHTHSISNVDNLQTTLDSMNTEIDNSIKSLSVSGKTITYTKNDGSTGTITTQDTNTDTKVTNTLATTTKAYVTGTTSATTNTDTQVFDTGVYLDTTAGQLVATTFKGALDGNAKTATSATSATKATQDGSGNTITSTYETKSDASTKLTEAKTYADNAVATVKNDLLNGAGAAYDTLKELGDLIVDNQDAIDALETVAASKADKSHTHNYAGSSSAGGAATSANKVNSSLTVKLNSGTTEGTNMFTFNGGSAKNINITPSAIGASASGHTHDDKYYTETEIDTKLSGKANSSHGNHVPTTQTANNSVFLRNDNSWATVTPANIGAAASSHNHTVANITDLTATATELNYMDGVTSNVQTQLDGKAASSHSHTITASASDDDVVVLTGTNGSNKVTYSASHANSGVTAGTYKSVTVNAKGHITAGSNPTTLSGYGITNAYTKTEVDTIASGKAATSHNHAATNITSGTLSSDRLPTIPITKGGTGATTAAAALTNLGITATATELNKLDGVTATTTELNYVDGVTSNIQTQLDGKLSISTKYAASSSVGGSATSAVKLQTPRKIGLGTGVTGTATSFDGSADITIPVTDIKESYLSWGGKNFVGSVSPIGASLSSEHSANRLAYLNPAAVKVEYSNDAGSTWSDSGLGNSAKTNFVTTSNSINVGSNSTVTTNHRTRVTLTAQDGTNGYIYTRPRKMLINVSTPHGLTVTIEVKTGVSGANWTSLGTYELSGWSGWNDIPMSISTFGGGANQTGNYWYMRLTFANTSVNSSYTTTKSSVIGLRLFGDTCWTRTSNMGETGHLYSYDSSQNATFPANVTANTFVGALSGNAATATNVAWSGVTSKPSYYDAKAIKSITRSGTTFTYTCMDGTTGTFTQQDNNTTYNVATTSANGLMSASDKSKLDSMELATLAEVKTYLGI